MRIVAPSAPRGADVSEGGIALRLNLLSLRGDLGGRASVCPDGALPPPRPVAPGAPPAGPDGLLSPDPGAPGAAPGGPPRPDRGAREACRSAPEAWSRASGAQACGPASQAPGPAHRPRGWGGAPGGAASPLSLLSRKGLAAGAAGVRKGRPALGGAGRPHPVHDSRVAAALRPRRGHAPGALRLKLEALSGGAPGRSPGPSVQQGVTFTMEALGAPSPPPPRGEWGGGAAAAEGPGPGLGWPPGAGGALTAPPSFSHSRQPRATGGGPSREVPPSPTRRTTHGGRRAAAGGLRPPELPERVVHSASEEPDFPMDFGI